MILRPLPSEFPYIRGKFNVFFISEDTVLSKRYIKRVGTKKFLECMQGIHWKECDSSKNNRSFFRAAYSSYKGVSFVFNESCRLADISAPQFNWIVKKNSVISG
jgi:hypothetical protein